MLSTTYTKARLSDRFHKSLSVYNEMLDCFLKDLKGYSHVLDVDCGSGNLSIRLANDGHIVTCIDKDPNALDELVAKSENNEKMHFVLGDFNHTAFGRNSFDAVASSFVLPYIPDAEVYFKKIHDIIRDEGRFVLSYRYGASMNHESKIDALMIYRDLCEQNILPAHENEWREIMKECASHKNMSVKKKLSMSNVKKGLEIAGFDNIRTRIIIPGNDYVMISADKS